jgi:diguanylate cyclase (GGDEF)-like protein
MPVGDWKRVGAAEPAEPAEGSALGLALALARQARTRDEPGLLTELAEAVRVLTGARRARVVLAGDEVDPSVQVAVAAGQPPANGVPLVLDANAPGHGFTVALPLGSLGLVVVEELANGGDTQAIDVAAGLAELVSASVEVGRRRAELELLRRELAELRARHEHERAEQERRLRKLNQLKDEVLSVCAHDLRSPLHVILSHAALLMDEIVGPVTDAQRHHLDAIDRQGRRMATLIEELLHARRSGIDTLEVVVRESDLAKVLAEWSRETAPVAAEKGITLETELPALPEVAFDEGKLRQVVVNLLANAVKFTPPGGRIRLSAVAEPTRVVVAIADSGPGVPPDEVDTIFERFRQGAAGVRSGQQAGVGMGLAICKEIILRHGGEIWVEPVRPAGACFRFALPARVRRASAVSAWGQSVGATEKTRRILLVEDDEQHAEMVALVLRERGHQVELARDGAEGVERARQLLPDLVLLDVQMPRVDGFTAAERLQRDARTRDIPIVFLSACESGDARVRGLKMGAADFLTKPFHAAELLTRVERTLDVSDQRRRLLALANEDPLTGVGNVRFLRERLRQEHARVERYGMPLAVVAVELEGREELNRRQGQQAGDRALCRVGHVLRELVRESDTVARSAGAEFVVVLSHAGLAEAKRFVERVRAELGDLEVSFGAAATGPGSESCTPEELLRAAEDTLARQRQSGGGT